VQETAKHHRSQSSLSSNSSRQKTLDSNANYWNYYSIPTPENSKPHHKKSSSVSVTNSTRIHSQDNLDYTSRNKMKKSDHNALLKNFSHLFDEAMASPQAIDLTSSPKSSIQFSDCTSLLTSQFLGVPTPPVSNLANSSSHFQSNTSNFINSLYQFSNMSTPIYNLVY